MKTYACGHINPDSDSVCSAISLSYLKTKLGEPCTPARQGELSPETEFILKTFGLEAPEFKNIEYLYTNISGFDFDKFKDNKVVFDRFVFDKFYLNEFF